MDCKYNKFYCTLADSTVIWNSNIFHSCPYEKLDAIDFFITTNMEMVYTTKEKLLFVIKEKMNACNQTIYTTNENLFLAFEPNKINRSGYEKFIDLMFFSLMELAEKDMSAWKTWKELVRVELTECKLIHIMMQTLQGQEDKFHRVNIPDSNKSVIIYSNYDTNYLP